MKTPTENTLPIEAVQELVLPTMPGVVIEVVISLVAVDGEEVETGELLERFVRLDREGPDVWLSLDDQLIYELHVYHSWSLVSLPLRLFPIAVHDFLAAEGFDPDALPVIVGAIEAASEAIGARRG